jgi:hypothetical protein
MIRLISAISATVKVERLAIRQEIGARIATRKVLPAGSRGDINLRG